MCWCLLHEMFPVIFSHSTISEVEQNISKQHLVRIFSTLTHDLIQNDSMVKALVGGTAKVRQSRAWHSGVEGQIHYRRELTKVSKQQARAASEYHIGLMRKHLSQTLVNLAKHLSSNHGHLINDEVLHVGQGLLHFV